MDVADETNLKNFSKKVLRELKNQNSHYGSSSRGPSEDRKTKKSIKLP